MGNNQLSALYCFVVKLNAMSKTFLFSSLPKKYIKSKIIGNIILPVVLYGCENWSLTLREECRLRVFENTVLRRIFGPKRDKVAREGKNYITRNLIICTPHPGLFE
jgi:hypothetical protein